MSDQSLLSTSLFRAASAGSPDDILALLAKGANPAASGSQALCLAAERCAWIASDFSFQDPTRKLPTVFRCV